MFFEGRFFSGGLSLKAIHQSSGGSFRDFFVKTTKESKQPFWSPFVTRKRPGFMQSEARGEIVLLLAETTVERQLNHSCCIRPLFDTY